MKNVLCIGSINMDLVINTDRIPEIGETIHGKNFLTGLGGKGANQAIAAARLELNVRMLGAVGNDIYGKELLTKLKKENIAVEDIRIVNAATGVAMITVCKGDNFIILDSGANNSITKEIIDINDELLNWADIVIFQLEIPIDTVMYAIKKCKKFRKKVILNPAPMTRMDKEILKYVDILIPNKSEAEHLLDKKIMSIQDAKEAVQELNNMGVKQVVLTLGSVGCVYNFYSEVLLCSAIKTTVVDTTAAGDSFIGGICKGLSLGMSIDEAVHLATAVASLTVSKKGASESLPFIDDVIDFMSKI